jgi:hypothetical protein
MANFCDLVWRGLRKGKPEPGAAHRTLLGEIEKSGRVKERQCCIQTASIVMPDQ